MIFLHFCKSEHALYQHISLLSLLLKVVSVPLETGCFFFHGGGDFWGVPLVSLAAFTPFCDVMSFQGREFTGSHAPA